MSGNQYQLEHDLMDELRAPDYTPDIARINPSLHNQIAHPSNPSPPQRQHPQLQPQCQQLQPPCQQQQPRHHQQQQQRQQQQQLQSQRPSINTIADGLSRLQALHPHLDTQLTPAHAQQPQVAYTPPHVPMNTYSSNPQHYMPQQQAHVQQHAHQPQQQRWYAAVAFDQQTTAHPHQQISPGPRMQNPYYQHPQQQNNDITNSYDSYAQQPLPIFGVFPFNAQLQQASVTQPRQGSTRVHGSYASGTPSDWPQNRHINTSAHQSSVQLAQVQQNSPLPQIAHSASPRLVLATNINGRQHTSPSIRAHTPTSVPAHQPIRLQPRGPRAQDRTTSVNTSQPANTSLLRGQLINRSVANIIHQQPLPVVATSQQPAPRPPIPQQTNESTTLPKQSNRDHVTPPSTIVNVPSALSPVTVNPIEKTVTPITQAPTDDSTSTLATTATATNTSVSSTTRPSSVEASPPKIETFNKACQVRLLVKPETVNRALMVAPEVEERWCQTDEPEAPVAKTYVDRASSPILFQTNVKTKQTPKRRKIEDEKDSDGDIDVG